MVKNGKKTLFLSIFLAILCLTTLMLVGCGKTAKIQSVEFKEDSIEMFKEQILDLEFKISPSNAGGYIQFKSSNTDIALVDKNGRVYAKDYGSVDITLSVVDSEITDVCHITIGDGEALFLNDVECLYDGKPLQFYEGQVIDKTKLSVTGSATYQSGKVVTLSTSDFKIDCPTTAALGGKIKVTYQKIDKTIDFSVLSDQAKELRIKNMPTKVSYTIGEVFAPEGLVLELVYNSGKTEEISTAYTYDTTKIEIGQTSVEVKYLDFNAFVPIESKAEKTVNTIEQLQQAIKDKAKTIQLTARIASGTVLEIEDVEDMTIFALPTNQNKPGIIGTNIMPIKIKGNVKNLKIMGIEISRNDQEMALIDLSECQSGSDVTFESVIFSSSQENYKTGDNDVEVSLITCQFNEI